MNKINIGEVIELENGQEYVCFGAINENGRDFVYLISNFKPLKVRFAEQHFVNNELAISIVEDQQLKEHLLDVFQKNNGVIR